MRQAGIMSMLAGATASMLARHTYAPIATNRIGPGRRSRLGRSVETLLPVASTCKRLPNTATRAEIVSAHRAKMARKYG